MLDAHITVNHPVDPKVAGLLDKILKQGAEMAASLENVTREVAEIKTVAESAKALIVGLKSKLDEAIAQLPDQSALDALAADLDATANDLSAAVTANTPADPAA